MSRRIRMKARSVPESVGARAKGFLKRWVIPLALGIAVLAPLRSAIADWNDVPSGSMMPTILEGERIVVNKLSYGLRVPFTTTWISQWEGPSRGDVVTLASPADGIRLVKRVVGIPGDRLSMADNRLSIDDVPVEIDVIDSQASQVLPDGRRVRSVIADERLPGCTHRIQLTPGIPSARSFREVVVPAGHYFVMGDNRDVSGDSRVFGFVARDRIYGRATYVALSVDPSRWFLPRFERWFREMR